MKFLADTMLGRLAKWLRILGYDTIYDGHIPTRELIRISNDEGRVFLTRNSKLTEKGKPTDFFVIRSENYREQISEVVNRFQLDTSGGLFTRCTLCNIEILPAAKESVKDLVPEKPYGTFNEFFQCPECKRVYWSGTHTENTIRRLKEILS
jgi:uncharacterized protein with PIN domain